MKLKKFQKNQDFERLTKFNCLITWFHQWKNSSIFFWVNVSTIALSFFATKRVLTFKTSTLTSTLTSTFKTFKLIIIQSTFDIKFSNVRFRNQTIKYAKTRKTLNEQHEFVQLKTQNQLNSKHDSIRFKFVIFQNRFFSMQKIEIFISKQFVFRYYLSQYIVNEKYMSDSSFYINFDFKFQKFFDSALRFIYDVFTFNINIIFSQHRYMTY